MFARIMAVVLAVILLLTMGLTAVCYSTLRTQQIQSRLDALKKDGREIAFLAARDSSGMWSGFFGSDTTLSILRAKADQVYEEYGAFILVVDRYGRVMDNMAAAYQEDPDFVESLNGRELRAALTLLLAGEEVSVRATVNGGPTFTVGVPFVQDGTVYGAVLIQTKAQRIEALTGSTVLLIALVALAALLVGSMGSFLYLRHTLRPLKALESAAERMAAGDFTARTQVHGADREVARVAAAFDRMAEKLADVEGNRREFVANVSHELRSPITSIRGFVEGMEDGTIPPEEHPKYLGLVANETRRLSKLIGDLLALSRLERDDAKLELTDFNICEMLRRAVVRRVNDLEAKEIEIACEFAQDPCTVRADSDRIEQVIVNLLDNAIKFTPQGGKITLRTDRGPELCTVTVADNGIGILPEDRPKVFDRFFTADRAHTAGKGTGLGLSICQRILEMHGQSIRLLDTAEGAAFAFTLPAGQETRGGDARENP